MPSFMSGAQPLVKSYVQSSSFSSPSSSADCEIQKQVGEIMMNIANKRSLAWSLSRLIILEKKLKK
jgi:hypothetical protein